VDIAFARRLHQVHVGMPTTDDIYETLRRYFLTRDSFITASNLSKLADDLDGSSFDDINAFLGVMNNINGRNQTSDAKYFRTTYSPDNQPRYTACLPNDPRRQEMDHHTIDIVSMPACALDLTGAMIGENSVSPFQQTCTEENIEKHLTYSLEGMEGVKKEKEKNEEEVLPNLGRNIKSGKYKQRVASNYYGFKYWPTKQKTRNDNCTAIKRPATK